MTISSVSIVSHNTPVFLASYGISDDEYLRQQSLMHMSLDAVEDRSGNAATDQRPNEPYLGNVGGGDAFCKVYAYLTNTNTRILLVDSIQGALKEEQLRVVFKQIHAAYVDAVSNPFYNPQVTIQSHRFQKQVRGIVTSTGGVLNPPQTAS